MPSKAALSNRHSRTGIRSRIVTLTLSMLATLASLYAAGRMWQDAEERVSLMEELDRVTGLVPSVVSVEDSLKVIDCREHNKKLSAIEMDLVAARQEGFSSSYLAEKDDIPKERPLVVIGVFTGFGHKNNRDAIRKAWMGSGTTKGIITRFVIGRSNNRGDSSDRGIDSENKQTNDFFILENYNEVPEEHSKKTKLFFALAADYWNADFYGIANDDVYVNIDALGSTLSSYVAIPRAYIGCMKTGEVFSEQNHQWYEPDWWKFGNKREYFRHASGEMLVITKALAKFVSINRHILRTYAHHDVSVGSWFIGADAEHIDNKKFCCSSWSAGAVCSGV